MKGEMLLKKFLEVSHISKKYQGQDGEVEAIKDISFNAEKGEIISIVGPSGCGKSTLLSIIAGLEDTSSGETYINGEKMSGLNSQIAYMLQTDNLLEWRNIYRNIVLGLEIQKKFTRENLDYVDKLIENYGLEDFKYSYPSQLSGGMKQRAALIRTLVVKPDVLLLDESFSALDYQTKIMVTQDVRKILKKENKTTLMVTHDIPESISMSDKIVVLTKRPSCVKKIHFMDFEDCEDPLERRTHHKFADYFNEIWRELNI